MNDSSRKPYALFCNDAETIEQSFTEAKELHGLPFARMLAIRNMYEQSYLTATN